MGEMTEAQRDFLARLTDKPTPRKNLPIADREQDKVRQSCRRRGWVEFVGGRINGQDYPMGWIVTPAGKTALEAPSHV